VTTQRLLWDMVLPYEHELGNDASILPRWLEAGFSFVSVHPAGDRHTIGEAMHRIARFHAELAADGRLLFARTTADIERARATGRLAVGLHLEGIRPLERDEAMVEIYHRVGVRFCHPVFNQANEFGGGCAEPVDTGITTFGRRVVREMNRVGVLLDGAHTSRRTTLDMIEASEAPVIFSHNGCDAVNPHFRNVTDEQIRACASSCGVVGITGMNNYLGAPPTNETLVRHLEHVAELVGPEHVGLGLDYVGDAEALSAFVSGRVDEWGSDWAPFEFATPDQVPALADLLRDRGWSEEQVDGVLGANFLRVAKEVWG
jgi:membrane dipeptidase